MAGPALTMIETLALRRRSLLGSKGNRCSSEAKRLWRPSILKRVLNRVAMENCRWSVFRLFETPVHALGHKRLK